MVTRLPRFVDGRNPTPAPGVDPEAEIFEAFQRRAQHVEASFHRIASLQTLREVYKKLLDGEPRRPLKQLYGGNQIKAVIAAGAKLAKLQQRNNSEQAPPVSLLDAALEGRLRIESLNVDQQRAFAEEVLTRGKTADSLAALLEKVGVTPGQLDDMFMGTTSNPSAQKPGSGGQRREKEKKPAPAADKREEPAFVGDLVGRARTIYDLTEAELWELVDFASEISEYGMREGPLRTFLDRCHMPLTVYRDLLHLETPEKMWGQLRKTQKVTVGHGSTETKVQRKRVLARSEPLPIDPDITSDEPLGGDPEVDMEDEDAREEESGEPDVDANETEDDSSLEETGDDALGETPHEVVEKTGARIKGVVETPSIPAIGEPDTDSSIGHEVTPAAQNRNDVVARTVERAPVSITEDPKGLAALRVLLRALPYYVEGDETIRGHRQALCECFGIEEAALGLSPQEPSAQLEFKNVKEMERRRHHPAFIASMLYLRSAPYIKRGVIAKMHAAFSLFPGDPTRWQKDVSEQNPLFDLGSLLEGGEGLHQPERVDTTAEEDTLQLGNVELDSSSASVPEDLDGITAMEYIEQPGVEQSAESLGILQDPRGFAALRVLARALPYYIEDQTEIDRKRASLCQAFGIEEGNLKLTEQDPTSMIAFESMVGRLRRKHQPQFMAAVGYLRTVPYKGHGAVKVLCDTFDLSSGLAHTWQHAEGDGSFPDLDALLERARQPENTEKTIPESDTVVEQSGPSSITTGRSVMPDDRQAEAVTARDPMGGSKSQLERGVVPATPDGAQHHQHVHGNESIADSVLMMELLRQNAALIQVMQQQAAVMSQLQQSVENLQRSPATAGDSTNVVRVVIDVHVDGQAISAHTVNPDSQVPAAIPRQEIPSSS